MSISSLYLMNLLRVLIPSGIYIAYHMQPQPWFEDFNCNIPWIRFWNKQSAYEKIHAIWRKYGCLLMDRA